MSSSLTSKGKDTYVARIHCVLFRGNVACHRVLQLADARIGSEIDMDLCDRQHTPNERSGLHAFVIFPVPLYGTK
jgi:hypothetical protein